MNKPLIFFSLFLVVSMGFVTIPNTAYADSQLDILIKITQNAKEHIKNDIDKLDDVSQQIFDFYDEGARETVLLIQAVENEDVVSARQHFISAMIAFKQVSLAISENESQKTPQAIVSDYGQVIKKYENNVKKLKLISTKLNADVDFEQLDQLLVLAKANNAKGNLKQTKDVLLQVLTSNPKVLKEPAPSVNVSELADSSVNFAVRPFCKPEDYWSVYFSTVEGCKLALDQAGIEIPYPHQVEIQKKG